MSATLEELASPDSAGARPGHAVRAVAGWLLVTLVAAGLVGAALRSARLAPAGALERLAPDRPGTTWLYQEVTNGQPTGTATVQVAGSAVPVLTTGVLVTTHVDNYLGRGQPRDEIRYETREGDQLVLLGVRASGTFTQYTPAQPLLELPVTPGHSFTWRGKQDNPAADLTVTTKVVAIETVTVSGQPTAGCAHVHDDSVESRSGQPDFPTAVDRWLCPGVGEVRAVTDAPTANIHVDEQLLSVHGPGIDLGPATPATTPAPAPAPAPATAPDPDTTRLAWSDSRVNAAIFPPVGRAGLVVVEEEGGKVVAFDPTGAPPGAPTGAPTRRNRPWTVEIAVPAAAAPVVADTAVLVPDAAKHLLALDPATGATRWSATFGDMVSVDPLVVGDAAIVATEDGRLRALALADGHIRWEATTSSPPSGLAQLDGNVAVATSDGTVSVRALDSGTLRWSGHLQGQTTAGPFARAGVVVVADDENQLSAFDLTTGHVAWTEYLRTTIQLPLAGTDTAVVAADGSRVRAFDLHDGHQRWTSDAGATAAPPTVVGNDVFVATRDRLLRLAVADGRPSAPLSLPRPTAGLRPRSALAPALIGDQLVVTTILDPGQAWPRTTLLAFADRASSAPAPAGVAFTGAYRATSAPPARAPTLAGNDLLLVDRSGTVSDAPATGPERTVLAAKSTGGFLVSAGGRLFTRDGDNLVAATPEGKRLWSSPLGSPALTDLPAVGPDSVVVPIRGQGLAALDPATGRRQWFFPVSGQGGSQPLVLPGGDVVYAVGGLVRLDGATGLPRWVIPGFEAFGPIVASADSVFAEGFFENDQVLAAVDAATGVVRWKLSVPVQFLARPATDGTLVAVVGGDEMLRVVDAASGQVRWTRPLATSPSGSPVILGSRVIVAEEGRPEDVAQVDHVMTVYDLATGAFLGAFEPGGNSFGVDSFGGADGRLLFPTLAGGSVGVFILGLGSVTGS